MSACKRCKKTTLPGVVFCLECLNPDTVRFWCAKCDAEVHMRLRYVREFFVEHGIRPIPTGGALYEFVDECPSCSAKEGDGHMYAYHLHKAPAEGPVLSSVTPG